MDAARTREQVRCGSRGRNVCVKLESCTRANEPRSLYRVKLFVPDCALRIECHNLGRDMKHEKPSARFERSGPIGYAMSGI